MNSKKWRNGYSVGFDDGYEKAKRDFSESKVLYIKYQEGIDNNYQLVKDTLDIWSDAVSVEETQPVDLDNEIPDGLSYEEIYGSVVYQQNKKRER